MRAIVWRACLICSIAVGASLCSIGYGQVVINEVVNDERTAGSGTINPDTREFVELYNAGNTAVDIGDWQIVTVPLGGGPSIIDTIPSGTMLGPNDYFVLGAAGVPNVDYTPPGTTGIELYADSETHVLELRTSTTQGGELVDALGYEIYRSGLGTATAEQLAEIGQGWYGQVISPNAISPNTTTSLARYIDGRDTDNNGYDFGIVPITPGTSNNIPQNASHTVPDVNGLPVGTELGTEYYASFILPTVINPMVADSNNPRAIPTESPQEGRAIVAWDGSGGGNAIYSKELVNSFDLYAYFETTPIGVAPTTQDEEWESAIYGIGTTDPFFANPDPTGGIFVSGSVLSNGSTGVGWMFQQYEEESATVDQPAFTKLVLVDMGDGGNSHPDATEWDIITEIDMSQMPSGWYRLGIDYDPTTGGVTARFDDQTFMFTTELDLVGNFYVGYREGITGTAPFDAYNPPVFDLFEGAAPVLAGDYNDDGIVDAEDYTVWRDLLGASTTLPNETVTPGIVTLEDFDAWKANFGAEANGAALGAGAVPEPGALVLGLVGALAIVSAGFRGRNNV